MIPDSSLLGRPGPPKTTLIPFVTLIFITLLSPLACKTPPTINPFDVTDKTRPAADLLDDPIARTRSSGKHRPHPDDADVMIPGASATMSRTIDGNNDDWDLSRARTYKTRADIEFGQEFWDGPNDASFRVALHADENYLYFLIDVIDDHIIISSPENPTDAVKIWLRDPGLERLNSQLPESYQQKHPLHYDTAIVITPDGNAYIDTPAKTQIAPGAMTTAALKHANGYSIEVALAIEALPQVSMLPLTEIAFRIELLDGDDATRSGPQTLLSMLPETNQKTPRFALFNTELLPHLELSDTLASHSSLGIWRQTQNTWQFQPLEALSNNWRRLEELPSGKELVATPDLLPQLCREARNDIKLLEAYQSANAQNRVVLLLCGPTPTTAQCPKEATSQLVWAHLMPDTDGWAVRRAFSVFENPLTQCGLQAAANRPFTQQFSMTPLTAVSPSLWAVGWHNSEDRTHEHIDTTGITLIDAQSSSGPVAEIHPQRTSAMRQGRTIRNSQVFFTQIDDKPGLDICEIEVSEDQECTNFNTNCITPEHSINTLGLIKTWNEPARKFEPYLFTKHPRCAPKTRFEQVDGFMLLYINQRFALLPARTK